MTNLSGCLRYLTKFKNFINLYRKPSIIPLPTKISPPVKNVNRIT